MTIESYRNHDTNKECLLSYTKQTNEHGKQLQKASAFPDRARYRRELSATNEQTEKKHGLFKLATEQKCGRNAQATEHTSLSNIYEHTHTLVPSTKTRK